MSKPMRIFMRDSRLTACASPSIDRASRINGETTAAVCLRRHSPSPARPVRPPVANPRTAPHLYHLPLSHGVVPMSLSDAELAELAEARRLLENPGIAAKLTNVLGKPIEKGFAMLPGNWRERVSTITRDALLLALK